MNRLVLSLFLLTAVAFACKSATTGVKWEPKSGAPDLGSRGDGCYVEMYEAGREPERPYKVVGKLVLDLNRDAVKGGGGADVSSRFKQAACEYGVFLIKDVKTFPDPTSGAIFYEATAAVWVNEKGEPILQQQQNGPAPEATGGDAGLPPASGDAGP